MNGISAVIRKFLLSLSLVVLAVCGVTAHPGHGLIDKNSEGIEHFILDPYHLLWILALTAVLFYVAIRLSRVFRKSAR